MEVKSFSDPAGFRSFVDPLLLRNEARNSLLFGITETLIDRPGVYEEFHLWAVSGDGDPIAAAVMTPPHNLLLADGSSQESLMALAEAIGEAGLELPGVQGNLPLIEVFRRIWEQAHDVEATLEVELGVHSLLEVSEPPPVAGNPRVAALDDFEQIVEWVGAFLEEADPLSPRSNLDRAVKNRLGVDPDVGGTWLWEVAGEPVALSGYGGRTPNGICIGPVYTPPHARRQGYATALVATQSAWLLERGRKFCSLFTDMANSTSNSIYRRIGYEKIGDARRYGFIGPEADH